MYVFHSPTHLPPQGDEDDYTIVQAHMNNKFDRVGIRRISSLPKAENVRAASEESSTSLEADYGKEEWWVWAVNV